MISGRSYGSSSRSFGSQFNWWLIICYVLLVIIGWLNIYATIHNDMTTSALSFATRSGKQFVWIITAVGLALVILFLIPPRVYEPLTPFLYGFVLLLLVAVIFIGSSVKGSHSWFTLGPIRFQPAEISKISTSLMLATIMSRSGFHFKGREMWLTFATIALPMLIIVAEKETGSALVYVGFIFVLYREGLSGWLVSLLGLVILLFILTLVQSTYVGLLVLLGIITFFDCAIDGKIKWWLGIASPLIVGSFFVPESWQVWTVVGVCVVYMGWSLWRFLRGVRQTFRAGTLAVLLGGIILVFSTNFIFQKVLKDYQRARIEVLLGMREDNSGVGYNVTQSKIAIGSGGMWGKGFCHGTQTAYGFVPEQSTDFIFCTVGEEWGFMGCLGVIALYLILIFNIVKECERSREAFTRIYGYGLASCLFMHLFINIGMTLGLMPVIGIPLPFLSYGGSSLWGFTVMLFIFIALDRNERKYF